MSCKSYFGSFFMHKRCMVMVVNYAILRGISYSMKKYMIIIHCSSYNHLGFF
jgi:hypothetical protein